MYKNNKVTQGLQVLNKYFAILSRGCLENQVIFRRITYDLIVRQMSQLSHDRLTTAPSRGRISVRAVLPHWDAAWALTRVPRLQ
jgi:hypothetical protein